MPADWGGVNPVAGESLAEVPAGSHNEFLPPPIQIVRGSVRFAPLLKSRWRASSPVRKRCLPLMGGKRLTSLVHVLVRCSEANMMEPPEASGKV